MKPITENHIEESAIETLQLQGKCLNYDLFDFCDGHDSKTIN